MKTTIKICSGLLILIAVLTLNLNFSQNDEGNSLKLENIATLNLAGATTPDNPGGGGGGINGVFTNYCINPVYGWPQDSQWVRDWYGTCQFVTGYYFTGWDACWF